MLSKKDLLKTKEYWVDELQNEIFRQVTSYMQENGINQQKLAEKLGVSKGYVSQILNGNCNFSMSKIVELALALDRVPVISFVSTDLYEETQKKLNTLTIKSDAIYEIAYLNESLEINPRVSEEYDLYSKDLDGIQVLIKKINAA